MVRILSQIKTFSERHSRFVHPAVAGLVAFILFRIWITLISVAGITFFPPQQLPVDPRELALWHEYQQTGLERLFLFPWFRWDTVHYLRIAVEGYGTSLVSSVWPPLYPALIRVFMLIFEPPLLAALVVSNFFTVVSFGLLYKLVETEWEAETARATLLWMAVFPTSFFLLAGYSESLFLGLTLVAFLGARQKQWLWAGLAGAGAVLVRHQGVLLAFPLAVLALRQYLAEQPRPEFRHLLGKLLPLAAMPLVFGLFALYVRLGLDAPWPWETLALQWKQRFDWPWVGIMGNLYLFSLNPLARGYLPIPQILDLALPLLAGVVLWLARKNMPLEYLLLAVVSLLFYMGKVDDHNLTASLGRYLLTLFPVFISMALVVRRRLPRLLLMSGLLILQILALIFFQANHWVA